MLGVYSSFPGALFNWTQGAASVWHANVSCPNSTAFSGNRSAVGQNRSISCSSSSWNGSWTGLSSTPEPCLVFNWCDPVDLPSPQASQSLEKNWGNTTVSIGDEAIQSYPDGGGRAVYTCLGNGSWGVVNVTNPSSSTVGPLSSSALTSGSSSAVTSALSSSTTTITTTLSTSPSPTTTGNF